MEALPKSTCSVLSRYCAVQASSPVSARQSRPRPMRSQVALSEARASASQASTTSCRGASELPARSDTSGQAALSTSLQSDASSQGARTNMVNSGRASSVATSIADATGLLAGSTAGLGEQNSDAMLANPLHDGDNIKADSMQRYSQDAETTHKRSQRLQALEAAQSALEAASTQNLAERQAKTLRRQSSHMSSRQPTALYAARSDGSAKCTATCSQQMQALESASTQRLSEQQAHLQPISGVHDHSGAVSEQASGVAAAPSSVQPPTSAQATSQLALASQQPQPAEAASMQRACTQDQRELDIDVTAGNGIIAKQSTNASLRQHSADLLHTGSCEQFSKLQMGQHAVASGAEPGDLQYQLHEARPQAAGTAVQAVSVAGAEAQEATLQSSLQAPRLRSFDHHTVQQSQLSVLSHDNTASAAQGPNPEAAADQSAPGPYSRMLSTRPTWQRSVSCPDSDAISDSIIDGGSGVDLTFTLSRAPEAGVAPAQYAQPAQQRFANVQDRTALSCEPPERSDSAHWQPQGAQNSSGDVFAELVRIASAANSPRSSPTHDAAVGNDYISHDTANKSANSHCTGSINAKNSVPGTQQDDVFAELVAMQSGSRPSSPAADASSHAANGDAHHEQASSAPAAASSQLAAPTGTDDLRQHFEHLAQRCPGQLEHVEHAEEHAAYQSPLRAEGTLAGEQWRAGTAQAARADKSSASVELFGPPANPGRVLSAEAGMMQDGGSSLPSEGAAALADHQAEQLANDVEAAPVTSTDVTAGASCARANMQPAAAAVRPETGAVSAAHSSISGSVSSGTLACSSTLDGAALPSMRPTAEAVAEAVSVSTGHASSMDLPCATVDAPRQLLADPWDARQGHSTGADDHRSHSSRKAVRALPAETVLTELAQLILEVVREDAAGLGAAEHAGADASAPASGFQHAQQCASDLQPMPQQQAAALQRWPAQPEVRKPAERATASIQHDGRTAGSAATAADLYSAAQQLQGAGRGFVGVVDITHPPSPCSSAQQAAQSSVQDHAAHQHKGQYALALSAPGIGSCSACSAVPRADSGKSEQPLGPWPEQVLSKTLPAAHSATGQQASGVHASRQCAGSHAASRHANGGAAAAGALQHGYQSMQTMLPATHPFAAGPSTHSAAAGILQSQVHTEPAGRGCMLPDHDALPAPADIVLPHSIAWRLGIHGAQQYQGRCIRVDGEPGTPAAACSPQHAAQQLPGAFAPAPAAQASRQRTAPHLHAGYGTCTTDATSLAVCEAATHSEALAPAISSAHESAILTHHGQAAQPSREASRAHSLQRLKATASARHAAIVAHKDMVRTQVALTTIHSSAHECLLGFHCSPAHQSLATVARTILGYTVHVCSRAAQPWRSTCR